jgi:hypothetical protein
MGQGTACLFAGHLAGTARFAYYIVLSAALAKTDIPTIEGVIDAAAEDGKATAIIFPHLRTAASISRMLGVLASGDRWSVDRVPWGKYERPDAALVRVLWRTSDQLSSSVGGFAPLGTMPATRRAPYVALVLWGGQKCNPHKRTPNPGEVGFIDIDTALSKAKHKSHWEKTDEYVRQVLSDPPEDVEHLRTIAFALPRTALSGANAWMKGRPKLRRPSRATP